MNTQLRQTSNYVRQLGIPHSPVPTASIPSNLLDDQVEYQRKLLKQFERAFADDGVTAVPDLPCLLSALSAQLHNVLVLSHVCGMPYLLPAGFTILAESYSTILWTASEVDALSHVQYAIEEVYQYDTSNPNRRIYRVSDYRGKVIKSPSYIPPNYTDLFSTLEGQTLLDFEHANRMLYEDVESESDSDSNQDAIVFTLSDGELLPF